MSNVSQILKQAAQMEKKAFTDFVSNFTQSGIVTLVKGGVPFEKAAQTMRSACESNTTANSHRVNADAFEKAAEYIDQLETELQALNKQAAQTAVEVQTLTPDDPLNKLASLGFSKEELEVMSQLPSRLIEKVATTNSQPWDLGNGSGVQREKTDPLLEFLLS